MILKAAGLEVRAARREQIFWSLLYSLPTPDVEKCAQYCIQKRTEWNIPAEWTETVQHAEDVVAVSQQQSPIQPIQPEQTPLQLALETVDEVQIHQRDPLFYNGLYDQDDASMSDSQVQEETAPHNRFLDNYADED
jgi:phage tail sheath gpL-like